jgi:hypothetical protein
MTIECDAEDGHLTRGIDIKHQGQAPESVTRVIWLEGDRRSYTGEYVPCGLPVRRGQVCTLPLRHHGSHVA